MIMQIFENDWRKRFFWFFVFTIFPEQAENKNKVRIKMTFLLMTEKHEAKKPYNGSLSSWAGRKDILKSGK